MRGRCSTATNLLKTNVALPDFITTCIFSTLKLHVFIGTWCEDSLPKLYATAYTASFPDKNITIIGVDRNKTRLGNLTEKLNVKNVPIIIAFKNGKELGPVVEYGKYGLFEKELAEIVSSR